MGTLQHRCADRCRILSTWVVVGDDDDVGPLSRNITHGATLGGVTVSPSTQDGDETPPVDRGPCRIKGGGNRLRSVREVDQSGR